MRGILDNILINGCEKFAFQPLEAEKEDSFQMRWLFNWLRLIDYDLIIEDR